MTGKSNNMKKIDRKIIEHQAKLFAIHYRRVRVPRLGNIATKNPDRS